MEYLGGDDILFLGQVFGIYSDMEALDYLTVVSVKYGDTSFDCNYLWPINLYEAVVVARDAIVVSADYRRVCRWDGVSGTTVSWQVSTAIPSYMVKKDKDSVLAVADDMRTAFPIMLSDGTVKAGTTLPFDMIAKPASLGDNGVAIAGQGTVALLSWDLKVISEVRDDRIGQGSILIPDDDAVIVVGSGFVAKIKL